MNNEQLMSIAAMARIESRATHLFYPAVKKCISEILSSNVDRARFDIDDVNEPNDIKRRAVFINGLSAIMDVSAATKKWGVSVLVTNSYDDTLDVIGCNLYKRY